MAASSPDWRRRWPSARGVAFVTTRGPEREFLALARVESFEIGGRTFTIVGGVAVDEAFLARLARDRAIVVSLRYPGGRRCPTVAGRHAGTRRDDSAVGELQLPVIRSRSRPAGRGRAGTARR